jgi:hypothetical protein
MNKKYRTMRGREIDMDKLIENNNLYVMTSNIKF